MRLMPIVRTTHPTLLPSAQGMLQRKCACGSHTVAGEECTECTKNKSRLQRKLAIGSSNDPLEREADRIAGQVLTMPAPSAVGVAPLHIQRYMGEATKGKGFAPTSVDRVLAGLGKPLEPALRQDMEQRFGHDFSRVRVHSGASAEQSTREVNANAYTVGHNVVFGAGLFAPETQEGRRLIAHELTHVVQQSDTNRIHGGQGNEKRGPSPIMHSGMLQLQERRPKPAPLDEDAEKIISVVMPNDRDKRDPQVKAVELIYRILNKYFPGYGAKVSGVGFDTEKAKEGLMVEQKQSATTKQFYGFIYVGDSFVKSLIEDKYSFADHVAKVAHELEHIDQWRSGLAGGDKKDEREFLAHYHEALFTEPAGAGKMHHSTRARHIDAALGLFHCLNLDLQKKYENISQELLTLRPKEAKYGHAEKYPNPPSTCTQPEQLGFNGEKSEKKERKK